MRKVIFVILFLGCLYHVSGQTNSEKITDLLNQVINFDNSNLNSERPIANVNLLAAQQADTMLIITKENAKSVLDEAKKYQFCIISVERHTIVIVESWNNCIQSGSWGYCMPYGTGYIQKGVMEKKTDYINNIIGIPDSQRRTVFLFNKK
ncbi:MAG: hypothetical protein JW717_06800 [Marinilabiliaceae bacterium]|nr:hypothetical protein [Marinilabiliaceae bacterium]